MYSKRGPHKGKKWEIETHLGYYKRVGLENHDEFSKLANDARAGFQNDQRAGCGGERATMRHSRGTTREEPTSAQQQKNKKTNGPTAVHWRTTHDSTRGTFEGF